MTTWTVKSKTSASFRRLRATRWLASGLATIVVLAAYGSPIVGPQPAPPKPAKADVYETKEFLKTRMNIPSLRLAIPVLDPGIPESPKEQHDQGIWPELRKSESVWTAFKLKEWMHRFNQFDSIVVSSDASISADVYLIGKILKSDGEIMRIEYMVVDSARNIWVPPKIDSHRVEVGWHERYANTDQDPFDPLYREIAEEVYEALKDRGKAHVESLERERRRNADGARRLTELERIAITRDLVFARFLSPEEFGEALATSGGRNEIQYLPHTEGSDWARVTSIQVRERDFATVVESYYEEFVETIADEYKQWQNDSFPIAREIRIAKRNRTLHGIAGALLIAGAVASGDLASDTAENTDELGAQVGAVVGSSLLVSSFFQNERRKSAVAEINELGGSLHASIKPTRIDLNGKVVTLSGSVRNQFDQWRTLMTEMYVDSQQDPELVRILGDEEVAKTE